AARPTLIGTNRHAGRELFTRLGRRVRALGVRGVRPAVYRLPAGDDRTAGRTTILARLGLADLAAADVRDAAVAAGLPARAGDAAGDARAIVGVIASVRDPAALASAGGLRGCWNTGRRATLR